ncbi:hypothetical protein QJQ45_018252, partial [Haematococcus lacustris]
WQSAAGGVDHQLLMRMPDIVRKPHTPLLPARPAEQVKLPANGKVYPGLGYKRDRPPKAQQQQPVDREAYTPPEPSQAQRNTQANGAAHWAHNHDNSWHAKRCKLHTLMRGVAAAGLEAGAVVPSEVVEARLYDQLVLWVEACSKRALLASLLLGLMVRDSFTRVTVLANGQELLEEIPAEDADNPDFAERNLYLQLGRGVPPPGENSRPSAAVEAVLTAYPDLHADLNAIPRYPQDINTVDDVGQKLETSFANSLIELFKRRVGQAAALAGARVIAGSHEHQRRLGVPLGGRPAWRQRQRSWVERSVRGKVVTWLQGQGQGEDGVVPTEAMRLVKAMVDKKRGVKANCANVQKAREVTAQRRAAEAAGPIEIGAQAGVIAAEAQAQAVAGAQLHQLQSDLHHRELQLAHNQRMQQLQQQLQDLQRSELQRKEQQLADLVAQQRAALLQWEHQLTEREHQLQQQQVDLSRREQDLTERKHQLHQQQADLDSREQQQARIQTLTQQLHSLQQELKAQQVAEVQREVQQQTDLLLNKQQMEAIRLHWHLANSCSCKAHHIKLDIRAIYGLMRAAGMLPADITSLTTFRNGVAGPRDSEPNDGQTFAQVVHTDGVTVSVLFTRPKPAGPPRELPRMGKQEGAVNPLAHLDADWLGCDPGKTNMATVAHEERYPSGAVESVWQRSLTAGQYYQQSGITQHAKTSKAWMAGIQPEHTVLSQVTNYTASLQRYREYAAMTLVTWPAMWAELSKPRWSNARFRLYRYKQSTVAKFWAETVRGAEVRCNSAATGRPLALAYGAAGFRGRGSIGSRGVPVKQMLKEACKQFPERVVLVHEFPGQLCPHQRGGRPGRVFQVAAPGAQHGDAVPDPGLDVLNKHQQHQVLRSGRAEVQRLRDVEQSLMDTVDGLQGDLDDLQAAHQRLQGASNNGVAKRERSYRFALIYAALQVAAPGAQHGDAVPDPGLDVLNKHQQHQVLRSGRVSRAEHPSHCSRAGRPRELSSWQGRPAMPNPGTPGQEWVCVRDRGLLRKRQRRHQRQR